MNVLITGSSGLIGQHLASLLTEKKIRAVGYDRNPPEAKEGNYLFEQGELEDFPRLAAVIKKHHIDAIVHGGGISHPLVGSRSPNQVVQTNIVGTNYIYEAANIFKVKTVIYLSSAAVYGDNNTASLLEDIKPTPTSIYGVSKIAGEYLAQLFAKQFGLEIITLRFPFVYGPGRRMPDPINDLIIKAKNGENITVDGMDQQLEFIYVKDAVRAIWLALKAEHIRGEVVNIGTGQLTPIREIAANVHEMFPNVTMKEGHGRLEYDEMGALDCSKAKRILGFEPLYSLKSGMLEYAKWIINQ